MAMDLLYYSLHLNSSEMMRVVYLQSTKHTHIKWCKKPYCCKRYTKMSFKTVHNRVQRCLVEQATATRMMMMIDQTHSLHCFHTFPWKIFHIPFISKRFCGFLTHEIHQMNGSVLKLLLTPMKKNIPQLNIIYLKACPNLFQYNINIR